ncbi:hypothetical protein Prudu_016807, partial [Prunus dulcis]
SSLSRAKTGRRLPELAGAASGHHRPRDRWRWNSRRVLYLCRPIPRPPTTCAGRKLRKKDGNSRNFKASDLPPPATILASGTRQARREFVRRSSELGPGAVACTRHPPPGHRDFCVFWFKSVDM